ncbi:MAG TPA: tripartite tricarboxylate transporter substrate binding protein [Alphaproteobacteria bacterium]
MKPTHILSLALGLAVAAFAGSAGAQQNWPTKPIKIVSGFPAGSGVHIVAQWIAEPMSKALGQNVIVEPRTGAGGNVGSEYVAKAPPDGHTLYLGTAGTHAINVSLYRKLPFDVQKDFAPITILGDVPNILIVNKDVPANNLKEFLALVRANPGKLNYGSSGNGTSMHLAGEQFKYLAQVDIVHVPYRGSPAATADLLAGQIQAMFHQVPTVIGQIREGAFRPLGVTTRERVKALPDVPTIAEAGLPGYESSTWYGLFAPAGTPRPIIDRINQIVVASIKDGEVGKKLEDSGVVPMTSTPEEFAEIIDRDIKRWREVIERTGTKLD